MKRNFMISIIWVLVGLIILGLQEIFVEKPVVVNLKDVDFTDFKFEKNIKYIIEKDFFEIVGNRYLFHPGTCDGDGSCDYDTSQYVIRVKNNKNQEFYMILAMINDYGFDQDYEGYPYEAKKNEEFIKELNRNGIYDNYYPISLGMGVKDYYMLFGVSIALMGPIYLFFAFIGYLLNRKDVINNDKI